MIDTDDFLFQALQTNSTNLTHHCLRVITAALAIHIIMAMTFGLAHLVFIGKLLVLNGPSNRLHIVSSAFL